MTRGAAREEEPSSPALYARQGEQKREMLREPKQGILGLLRLEHLDARFVYRIDIHRAPDFALFGADRSGQYVFQPGLGVSRDAYGARRQRLGPRLADALVQNGFDD